MKAAREGKVSALLGIFPTLESFAKEFTDWVEATHSLEHDSKRCYRNGWRLLKMTRLAGMKLDQITNHACETVSFPGSNSNANQALRTLRRMLSMAKELGKIQEVPKIRLRKEWGRSITMSTSDAEKIEARMKGDPRDAFVVIRATGVRPKEAFCLRWEFFLWDKLCYQNPKGKTKASRRPVPLVGKSQEVLRRRHIGKGSPSEGWVFPAYRGRLRVT